MGATKDQTDVAIKYVSHYKKKVFIDNFSPIGYHSYMLSMLVSRKVKTTLTFINVKVISIFTNNEIFINIINVNISCTFVKVNSISVKIT